MKGKLQFIIVPPATHQLEGIGEIKYLYDWEVKNLVISIDSVDICTYEGRKAISIFKKMSE
jgi:hypothetical protein